ncbi:MAG: DUF2316 family protein [Lacrimispora sp.]|uniref:DUF2316 family protein n=1 Tax=Lacrimispora sp. TaxID=2719234 RepID=UPI0039E3D0ED
MSLNAHQRKQTSFELHKNHQISGLSLETIRADLGFTAEELSAAFELSTPGHDPTDVWKLRDYLEKSIREQGKEPYPYSSLKVNIWYQY